ncbi:MAG: glycosyltransferase family 4 protein [Lachnospiraceae bacterium]|nr:glycosyltransferase family 4 protein [Lachnospiraceae bacterium]
MKILLVNKFLHPNGGSETYIFGLGEQLRKMGHEVQYFGMEHAGRAVGNRVESYTSDMDFHGGGLQKLFYPFKIIYSFEARKKLRPVLQDFMPDVVHLNNINFQLTPSVIDEVRSFEKKSGKSIRVVFTAHDYQWVCPNHMMMIPKSGKLCFACQGGHFGNCTKNRCIHGSAARSFIGTLEAAFYRWRKTYGRVDKIICPSVFMKKQLDTEPLLADKTLALHNFVPESGKKGSLAQTEEENGSVWAGDAGEDAAWSRLRQRLPERYALYFGRFSKEKGVETLLHVCKNMTNVSFVFAGTGPLQEEVSQVSNIRNVGFVTGNALRKLIEGAAFCLYPSEWYENCPFSVMESQACGTPMLASDLGGIPELLQDGVTGELFPAGDEAALREKIKKLWEQPKLCAAYRENCKKIKFDTSEEYCGKMMEQAYGMGKALF